MSVSCVDRVKSVNIQRIQGIRNQRWNRCRIDIVDPLPSISGKQLLLTMIVRHTSWKEAVSCENITSDGVIDVITKVLITYQGRQFQSWTFEGFCEFMGTQWNWTTAYYPQSNGKIDQWHQVLKIAIRWSSTDPNNGCRKFHMCYSLCVTVPLRMVKRLLLK